MRRLAAALLTSTIVLAGAVLAPTQAADLPPLPPGPVGQMSGAPAAELPVRAIVTDPVGDVETSPARLARFIDLRRVAYRTPARVDGAMTVRTTWQQLRRGNRPGTLRQRLITFIEAGNGRLWVLSVSNRRDTFRLFELTDDKPYDVRVRPEAVTVSHQHGARGQTVVTLSTEWLRARRVGLTTYGTIGLDVMPLDETGTRALRVGPRR